jgi:hypothetical protein
MRTENGWGSAIVSEHTDWWMDVRCRWHQGEPPPGWWQARDGRWRPPGSDDATEELGVEPSGGGRHLDGRGIGPSVWLSYGSWPRWARFTGPLVASLLVIGLLGAAATQAPWEGDQEGASADRATTAAQTDTAAPSDGTDPTIAAISTTTTPPDPGSTAPPGPAPTSTTVAPTTVPRPPTTGPPANDVHPGEPCSPVGATAVTADGVPMVCTAEKCHGAPFSQPRWRRAAC